MSFAEILGLTSGLLQSVVAIYALRLCRIFGTARVGWSLVSALGLLALPHLLLFLGPSPARNELGIKVDIVYLLVSLLLLTSMVHLEILLKERLAVEKRERRAQAELESRVQQQTAELTRYNEELRDTAMRLEAEVAERKHVQEQMERTHKELLQVSRQAGMSEVATGVLHNVGNVLNSVNVSADLVASHLADFKISSLTRAVGLMREQGDNLGHFITQDPRGKQLPEYLAQVAKHLAHEQHVLLKEIGFVKTRIDHIKEIVATQQSYGKVAGLTEKVQITDLMEDVLRMHSGEMAAQEVELRREYDPDLPEIVVDRHKVLQILLNLVTNAKHACLEAGGKGQCVTVRVTSEEGRLRVILSDNGVGIPPENLNRIFNHGFTTKKKGGHGFGLHSGALAAKQLGGALIVHSDGPGQGATFTLELPVEPLPQTSRLAA